MLPIIDHTKIGLKALQTNRHPFLFFVLFMCLSFTTLTAQEIKNNANKNIVATDSIVKKDSIAPVKNKEAVKHIISHSAEDYILEDVINKKVELYNKAHVIYDIYDITAGKILIDYSTNTVQARGIKDEEGKYSQLPVFKTEANETTQDSLIFNYKSKKAIIYGLETEQDGINTLGQKTKRVNDSTIFVRNIIFTTSDPRNPDYYLKTTKAKIVPGKKIITGPTNLVLADVPTPAIFPFAYFPLTKSRTSGLIFPTYGESFSQGFFLQNGGYYFAISDNFDLQLTGDLYSNSSYGFKVRSNYRVRYKYNGSFNFNYDNLITGEEGFSDFSVRKNFNLQWSHNQDSKGSPNSRFSSSVNLGSSQYFRQSINESNTGRGLQNTLNSSVTYSNNLVGTPFNMIISANHSQNTNTQRVTATLPSLQVNMARQYPFAPKSGAKKNALQNIGFNYSFRAENRVDSSEDDFFAGKILENSKNGARHNISLSTNAKLFKYFSLSPSINYREIWYSEKIDKQYNAVTDKVVTDTISGFTSFRDFNASASMSTTIYGMFNFKGKKLKAIRHTMRPSLSYTYRPDFSFYYDEVQKNEAGDIETYSEYDNGIYGSPSRGISNALSFSLSNTLEGKIANKDDPEGEDKKITILNSLNLSTGYDFTRETFKLSPLSLNAGTTLFKKMNVNFGASLDPYAVVNNSEGVKTRIDALSIQNGGPLVRLTSARISTGYSFSNKTFSKDKKDKEEEDDEEGTPHDQDLFGQNLTNTNGFQNQPEEKDDDKTKKDDNDKSLPQYVSSMPWNFRFSYSSNYVAPINGEGRVINSLTFSGDVELSPGWRVGASSGFDFEEKGFTYTNLRFSRDLSSWSMNFNWVPLGNNSSYYFFIGVKSSVLSDLKWDKRASNRDF